MICLLYGRTKGLVSLPMKRSGSSIGDFGKNTGLGMFLVQEILSLTGITIKETGVPGTGARFEINIPNGKYPITGRQTSEM